MYGYILDTCRVSGITSELFSDFFAAICQGFRGDITRLFQNNDSWSGRRKQHNLEVACGILNMQL